MLCVQYIHGIANLLGMSFPFTKATLRSVIFIINGIAMFYVVGSVERVRQLLEQGADVNEVDSDSVSLLHWAAINNQQTITRFVLTYS